MDTGWVKIHRKLLENPIAQKSNYFALWVTLLLKANHKETKMIWNNQMIVIKEGQFITGRDALSEQTGIHSSTIERILNYLENEHQIEQQKTTKYRLITIVNWKDYQEKDNKVNNKRTTNEQQANTNKNDNNGKNENKIIEEQDSSGISDIIKSFESINQTAKRFYGNTTQRKACSSLIESYGLERVKGVIENVLPKSNTMKFFPVITTPLQLVDKWAILESAINRYQSEQKDIKNKVAF